MHGTNNKVNYETNIKQKEKKYSWSTVFAWLYLKTIGRILPKRWNKWAENILYYNKATGSDEIRTDKTTDESAQIDLKPEVTVKESQSEIVSEDEKVQTNKDEATFQDTTMQTECVETTDKNIGADLKPEVAEKGSQSEIVSEDEKVQTNKVTFQDIAMQTDNLTTVDESAQIEPEIAEKGSQSEIISKDGEVQTEENSKFTGKGCFDTIVSGEFIDEDYDSMEEVSTEEDEELKKQLEDVSQELALERLQNVFLEGENVELRSTIKELEKNYKKLAEDADKREEELIGVKEKDMKINSLMLLNEALEQDKKEMEAEVENLKKQLQSAQESKQQLEEGKIDLEGKLKDLSSQLSAAEVEKKSSENEVSKLRKQVQILEGSKEWELARIQEQQKLQEQVEHLNAELERVRGIAMSSIQAHSETLDENLTLKNQQIESSTAKDEQQNGKLTEDIQGQTKTKASDTVSAAKSTTESTLSKLRNLPNKLFRDKNLDGFLSKKNEKLKKDFPEFKEKHFYHNVLDETIKSLSNQDDGKFESSELLELLESNLKESAKKILKDKVKKLDPGKNKEIFIEESAETRMKLFSDKIKELQLASSIRDKFLSTDQGMCNQTQGGVNEYQLTEKAKKEHIPNSSMSHANAASIYPSNRQKIVKVGS